MIYENETPIGITSVMLDKNDSTNKTVVFRGSWLEPHFRGKGLSAVLYQVRFDWAKERPGIEKIVVSHRASNLSSKYAIQKYGFLFSQSDKKIWADGAIEEEIFYERNV